MAGLPALAGAWSQGAERRLAGRSAAPRIGRGARDPADRHGAVEVPGAYPRLSR
ncbi:MAG: hypothetical protein LGR52_11085 [Candidatus Thiosymbion ectosymbiont of Robbea hypermnestra]|nr:hypothetical protein [Candidatus Thiosymbion ectosymbiont of Robbea hypermnestra]